MDETYIKLQEWSNILLPLSRHSNEPETLSSLGLSMDDAVWILYRLRELYSISDNDEKQRLMTMLPPTWGRDRIANWFRTSIPLRFLHLTIGETFEQFKMKYPNLEIGRSKFFSLRPAWVREGTPHESCLCIYHENADLILQVSNSSCFKFQCRF